MQHAHKKRKHEHENMLTSMANYIDFNHFTLEVEEQKG